jgi:hypothetical protein
VLEVVAEVEPLGDLPGRELLLRIGVLRQQRLEIAFATSHRHGLNLG